MVCIEKNESLRGGYAEFGMKDTSCVEEELVLRPTIIQGRSSVAPSVQNLL